MHKQEKEYRWELQVLLCLKLGRDPDTMGARRASQESLLF